MDIIFVRGQVVDQFRDWMMGKKRPVLGERTKIMRGSFLFRM